METQSVRKFSWLALVNLGFGILAFLSGLPLFVLFIALVVGRANPSSAFEHLLRGYFDRVTSLDPMVVSEIGVAGLAFGLLTLILGFIASISIQNKVQRGIAFVGNILGTLGMVGNTITILFFVSMTIR